ncbi:uncharacterized protein LOC114124854 [Aphis gossypii]|uniref:uncharacterized protein LOC114124854 n=1 Tax=Aphis gossypii TaxID=80765 RepID=UPI0021598E31|nr:uncharacterized protein LOC114124854 [Aphis gossypii]
MDKKIDYVSLLNTTRKLKHTVDELINKNQNELDILEIKRLRKSIEKMVKKYSSDKKVNNVQQLTNNCSNFGENITKSNIKEIIDVSSCFCDEMDTMKSNLEQKMEDNEECQNVTNEDNTNKRQNDLNKKCESQLKFYKEYVTELEYRLKGFIKYMIEGQRSKKKHLKREIHLKSTIEKIKRNECYYKATVQRLSGKLDYANKKSEERQKWIDGVVSQVEKFRCFSENIAKNSADLAELLSSFAVDLSVSNQLRHSEVTSAEVACDDQDRVSNPSGSSEIVDKSASGCSQPTGVATPASVAVVTETFLQPMSHSTPIRDVPSCHNCRCSFSTSDDSNDESEDDDHPSACL